MKIENNRENIDKTSVLEDIYQYNYQEYQNEQANKNVLKNPEAANRLMFFSIIFFGFLALIVGWMQFKYHLTSPFKNYYLAQSETISLENNLSENFDAAITKDTDQDGLSDYDEINVYGTSPYLEDTDSDGVSDFEEIKKGTDPNCLKGANCGQDLATMPEDIANGTADNSQQISQIISGQATATDLRGLLVQGGIPEAELNKLSDEELQSIYNSLFTESGEPATTAGSANQANISSLDDIKKLPPAQLRDFLKNQGVDQSLLDNVNDSELTNLVNEIIK